MGKWEAEDPRGVVFIIHGAGEHHARYKWLAQNWNEHGIDVMMSDLPGQGKTRGIKGHIRTFNQYLDTVDEWLQKARKKALPIILLGHSMGGLIAIRLVMERSIPLKGVILSSPCVGLSEPPTRLKEL